MGVLVACAGGCLQLAQLDVTYIGRAKLRDTIAEHGLVVSDLAGNEYHFDGASTRVDGSLSRSTLERAGDELVIVVAVKSRDTMSVAREIYAAISSQMQHHRLQRITIISLQNGVTNGNVLRTALAGLERAVVASDAAAATTTTTSERQLSISIADASFGANVIWQEPNRFYLATDNPLYIGSEKHGHVSRIVRALNGTKQMLRATETPNIRAILYSKLLVNLNNSCNALAGIPLINQLSDRCVSVRPISRSPDQLTHSCSLARSLARVGRRYRVIVAAAIEEGLAVLKAANIELARIGTLIPSTLPTILRLPDGIYRILAAKSIRIDRNARSSISFQSR